MNQAEYMHALEKALRKLPANEKNEAILFYQEYFAEAGPEKEQETIADLGSPKKLAAQITAQSQMKEIDQMPNSAKKGLSSIGVVILVILASPIALPIAIVVIAIIFTLVVTVFAILVSLFASAVGIAVGGIALTVMSFFFAPLGFFTFLFAFGSGLTCMGIGLLLFMGTLYCVKGFAKLIASIAQKMVTKESRV